MNDESIIDLPPHSTSERSVGVRLQHIFSALDFLWVGGCIAPLVEPCSRWGTVSFAGALIFRFFGLIDSVLPTFLDCKRANEKIECIAQSCSKGGKGVLRPTIVLVRYAQYASLGTKNLASPEFHADHFDWKKLFEFCSHGNRRHTHRASLLGVFCF